MKPCVLDKFGKLHFARKEDNEAIPHTCIAERLFPDSKDSFLTMLEMGYIVLFSEHISPYAEKEPTQAQINILFDLKIQYVQDYFEIGGSRNIWKIY